MSAATGPTNSYPGYDVLSKWESVSYDSVTRGVLRQRMGPPPERRFFTPAEFTLLEALAARLAPTPDRGPQPPIAPWIDAELYEHRDEGFRKDGWPTIPDSWRKGLDLIGQEARASTGQAFEALDEPEQTAFLKRLQAGQVDAARWTDFPADGFFADMLLKTVVGVYYAYPVAWSEMGFSGPASPRGYVRLGLNERDPWEAREAKASETRA